MRRKRNLSRQHEHIRELIAGDPTRADYVIAQELGCSNHTVARTREQLRQLPPRNGRNDSAGHANVTELAHARRWRSGRRSGSSSSRKSARSGRQCRQARTRDRTGRCSSPLPRDCGLPALGAAWAQRTEDRSCAQRR
jgi:hypothetical protein